MQSLDRLSGATVFVTGADGFIGSHLVEVLVEFGARVTALVYYNSWNSYGWLQDLDPAIRGEVEILPGDIRDAERIRGAVSGQEYVFHLSSLIGIPYSYVASRSYVDTNVTGALNVLEACRANARLRRLVHVSTSEVYGSAQRVPIDEDHPLVGQSPYSASKIAADKLAESFHLSFGLPVVTARPFNTFGPRQTARAVIPTIASQLLAGTDELRLGSVSPTRDFNYVRDTARAMTLLGCCAEAEGQVVNIATGKEASIGDVASMLMRIIGRAVPIVADDARIRPDRSEVSRLLGDASKLKAMTGWTPRHDLTDGLTQLVEWMRPRSAFFNPKGYTI